MEEKQKDNNFETVNASIIDGVLYVNAARSKFLPSYVYYMLEHYNCDYICFNASTKMYPKENLKGKESWNGIKYKGQA